MVKCVKCECRIKQGEGRYNFPTGAQCMICGEKVNKLLDRAEKLIDEYGRKTGYKPKVRFF